MNFFFQLNLIQILQFVTSMTDSRFIFHFQIEPASMLKHLTKIINAQYSIFVKSYV